MKKNLFKEVTLMNALLCLFVVLIHLTSAPIEAFDVGSWQYILSFAINKALVYCVPAFLFLSGLKLYAGYEERKIDLPRFWWGRCKKILIPYIVATLVYFLCFYLNKSVKIAELPMHLLLGSLVVHFYYIIIAVQCYIAFPLLKVAFKKFPIAVIILSAVSTVVFNQFVYFPYRDRFIGTYILYFVMGMAFAKYKMGEKDFGFYLIGIFVSILVGAVHNQYIYATLTVDFIYTYANLITVVYVLLAIWAVYGICLKASQIKWIDKVAGAISDVSYNVYLYHFVVIFAMQYYLFPESKLSPGAQFWISAGVVYGLIAIYTVANYYIKKLIKAKRPS